ncbi:MAG: hypothetical protein MZV64_15600 [Ignavibacteriales bacterium]|nr:hypothetical protein [Ignavibacteriales bacterium]
MPVFATIFMIITFSSIGLPGTNGFVGEFLILVGAFESESALVRGHCHHRGHPCRGLHAVDVPAGHDGQDHQPGKRKARRPVGPRNCGDGAAAGLRLLDRLLPEYLP